MKWCKRCPTAISDEPDIEECAECQHPDCWIDYDDIPETMREMGFASDETLVDLWTTIGCNGHVLELEHGRLHVCTLGRFLWRILQA